MASYYAFLVLITSLMCCFGITRGQFFCFLCQSPIDPSCNDPFNVTTGRSYDCNTLDYGTRSMTNVDNEVPLIGIFRNERLTANTTYGCIKVHVSQQDNRTGIIRTCHPNVASIDDQCDFISRETSAFNVTSCHYCESDRCNSASYIAISGLATAVILVAPLKNLLTWAY